MKSSAFYNVFLALFIIGLIVSAYYLYSLPMLLEKGSSAVSPGVIDDLSPVFRRLDLSVGITLLVAIYCIFLLAAKNRKAKVVEKIVYVDKKQESKEEEKNAEADIDLARELSEIEGVIKQKRTLETKSEALINSLCQKIDAGQGILYRAEKNGNARRIRMMASYAYSLPDSETLVYEFGEGLAGQAAKEGKAVKVDQVPDGYINIISGLGSASPNHLLIKPVVINGEVEAVVELASFKSFTAADEALIDKSISLLENDIAKEKGKTEEKAQKEPGSSKKDK